MSKTRLNKQHRSKMQTKCQVFMVVKIQVEVFWAVMSCSATIWCQHFGGEVEAVWPLNVGILKQH